LPGALFAAADAHGIDLASSYMVGDRWRDTEAGEHAGCKTIFIDHGYQENQPQTYSFRVQSLAEATIIILGK
jgi:D-glycero-D-manno-heptose 1,7-bisphosphate phosphatase